MEIDHSREIVDMEGQVITVAGEKPMTLKTVVLNSILLPIPADRDPVPGQAVQLFELANKFKLEKPDLTVEEVALLKRRIETAAQWSPWIVGQALQMIEGKV